MISFSIVIYKNSTSQLKKVIESIQTSTIDYSVFVIDNSPTDNLRNLFEIKNFHYTFLNKNSGFGAAHNIAIKKAFGINSQYHIVVNPDIYFPEGTIEKIIEYMTDNLDVGLLMPKVLYPSGQVQYLPKLLPTPFDLLIRRFSILGSLFIERLNRYELKNYLGNIQVSDVPIVSGCFSLFNIGALKKVGVYDESFFMYFEDFDISRRIRKQYRTVYYSEVCVFHEYERGAQKSIKLFYIFILSLVTYFNKWGWLFDKERKEINRITLAQFKK